MKLSGKQLEAFTESTARLNFWQGAVRSGKTYSSLVRLLEAIRNGVPGDVMIVGVSREAIQRNVISELCKMIGAPEPSSKTNEIKMLGRKIHLIGASDERAVAKIQGSTLSYAYCDELTRLPEPFFRMLLSRLSVKGAQLFASMNPEGPKHWCKKDFLDRESELDLRTWKFTLDDNPSLDPKYVEDLKKEYQGGAWHKRYILGEWAVAHGLVYDGFDEEINTYIEDYPTPNFYVAACDYGTINPTCCLIAGISPKRWPQIHIEKEYYYNSAKSGRQKTDSELAEDIKEFIGYKNIEAIYLDPAAASFKEELRRIDLPVCDALNDVIPGIRTTHKFITHKNLVIHKSCKNLLEEIQTYSWDPKAADRGEDKPLKVNDHCVDSLKYLCYSTFPQGEISCQNEDISLAQRRKKAFGQDDSWYNAIHGFSPY